MNNLGDRTPTNITAQNKISLRERFWPTLPLKIGPTKTASFQKVCSGWHATHSLFLPKNGNIGCHMKKIQKKTKNGYVLLRQNASSSILPLFSFENLCLMLGISWPLQCSASLFEPLCRLQSCCSVEVLTVSVQSTVFEF